jgi:hypothetical protein
MFCEVLPDSWTKGFYKREGKSNVKEGGGWLRGRKLEKRLERGITQGVRTMYFTIFTTMFEILWIWMWT